MYRSAVFVEKLTLNGAMFFERLEEMMHKMIIFQKWPNCRTLTAYCVVDVCCVTIEAVDLCVIEGSVVLKDFVVVIRCVDVDDFRILSNVVVDARFDGSCGDDVLAEFRFYYKCTSIWQRC